ncbi:MAG: TVP38/TMEM64 family protein [Sandaracinaceae bacterium]|nr:TVP38/TMEM64 family protein [Sandaracinaceae bacterium]MBP7680686.1 TVP38/TMEM64 family protein [Deltaproteobacteria bacterium]MBK7150705.1 TVP38/TMEM64 family protein [Sandaracinaceae bacterium]MBK7777602.1 TVP38/TMEM64 family protein [Sandaracinaceae bacterium]MBK8412589.1 TVP38/TMEM64 family protein [Sandaracinaceae bacterium]
MPESSEALEDGPLPPRRTLTVVRTSLVLLAAVGIAVAYRAGVFAELSNPAELARDIATMGVAGYVVFVVAFALLQPFGAPGTVFVIAAPLIWPWKTAFALSMTGTMAASVIGFSFARFVARDWVSARIPANLRKYDEALARNAFRTVFFLRMVLWMPQALHAFLGISKVRFSTHFWGSLLGYAPPLFLMSYMGSEMFDLNGGIRPGAWPVLGAMLAVSVVLVLGLRWHQRRTGAKASAG